MAEKRPVLNMPKLPLLELNLFMCKTSTGGHRYSVSFFVAHTPLRLQAWQLYPSSSSSVSVSVKESRHSYEHSDMNQQMLPPHQQLIKQLKLPWWHRTHIDD